jgi:hypothetical protein
LGGNIGKIEAERAASAKIDPDLRFCDAIVDEQASPSGTLDYVNKREQRSPLLLSTHEMHKKGKVGNAVTNHIQHGSRTTGRVVLT